MYLFYCASIGGIVKPVHARLKILSVKSTKISRADSFNLQNSLSNGFIPLIFYQCTVDIQLIDLNRTDPSKNI